MMDYGLNLYSLRNFIKTEADFLDTARKLKEMGYTNLQYSGAPFDADMIKRVSDSVGIPIVLTHVPFARVLEDTEALMEEHSRFNCKNIGIGSIGPDIIVDEKLCKERVEKLNLAAEKMNKNGFSFFYHNHHFEFYKYGTQTLYDYMIENAPYINFTFDTYWIQRGGASVTEYVEKLKGRIECVHLKDFKIIKKDEYVASECAVGEGVMNFKSIIPKMIESGTKYFIVEQDNAVEFPEPLAEVKKSIDYLKGEF